MSLTDARRTLWELAEALPERPGRVRLDRHERVAQLVIDNPSARNALTVRMMAELADAVRVLDGWNGSVVVLRSEGHVFCAGGHLGEVRAALVRRESGRAMSEAMTAVLDALLDLPVVSIAALQGPAIGGGAELSTACDLRIMARDARIHFVHARLGVAPGWGGAARLVGIVGRRRALSLLTRAEPVGADDALAIGLADAVGDLRDEVDAAVERLTALPPASIRAVKQQIALAAPARRDTERTETGAFLSVWGSGAHKAALDGGDDP